MTKLPGNKLRLSSGKVVQFKSAKKRENFEKVARATKHGFKPSKK